MGCIIECERLPVWHLALVGESGDVGGSPCCEAKGARKTKVQETATMHKGILGEERTGYYADYGHQVRNLLYSCYDGESCCRQGSSAWEHWYFLFSTDFFPPALKGRHCHFSTDSQALFGGGGRSRCKPAGTPCAGPWCQQRHPDGLCRISWSGQASDQSFLGG